MVLMDGEALHRLLPEVGLHGAEQHRDLDFMVEAGVVVQPPYALGRGIGEWLGRELLRRYWGRAIRQRDLWVG
jgi:hypothetical protein